MKHDTASDCESDSSTSVVVEERNEEHRTRESLIDSLLPSELLVEIISRLSLESMGRALCVSRAWNALGDEDFLLWKRVCRRIFREAPSETLQDAFALRFYGSWKNMFIERPRVRLDGVYVSRNTYVRTGVSEWRREKPVHLCVYFRYLRFLPGGKFVYRTSPYPLKQVLRSLTDSNNGKSKHDQDTRYIGRYRFLPQSSVVQTAFRYQNSFGTEVRSKLRLRGTTPGSFNRLDIENIVTWDRDRDVRLPMLRLDEEENEILGERRDHRTTDTAYVFVPFEQASSHILNLGVDKLDYFVP